ncbi:MAG: inorganic phosphate transporter, partial [Flavobacteriaceae bacterium]|nr:inorganic phosphate transporter [Flavobacteriaceae bacterium]
KFQPNALSRAIVRGSQNLSNAINSLLPERVRESVDRRFEKPIVTVSKDRAYELPAFDAIRASVNLMVAGVLISIATSYKLPLSTTYVTFMVAMGTSLADRAWGSESAVYRVAGVINVIGGWFFTAFSAFLAAAIMATLIYIGKAPAIAVLLFLAVVLLARNYISHKKLMRGEKEEDSLKKAESSSLQGVIYESAENIANVVKRGNKIYTNAINGLAKQDLDLLKKNKKQVTKLSNEVDELRDHIFYFIKNLDESSVGASNFYITVLGHLQDLTQSLEHISKVSHKHIHNNHKKLKFSQIKELKEIDEVLEELLMSARTAFKNNSFDEIGELVRRKTELVNLLQEKIEKQVNRTRTEESSPKNTTLYFGILLETKDLISTTMALLEEYHDAHDERVPPARIVHIDKK